MKNQLEQFISCYDLGFDNAQNRDIKIELRSQADGAKKWVLFSHGCVLNKDLQFEYEPMPSNRDDEFIERTRFNSAEEVFELYKSINFKIEMI